MAESKQENARSFDPFESFRGMRDAYLETMSKNMVDAVNTESYAQASGAMLDYCLTASAPLREALEKSMLQAMQQLSLPSRRRSPRRERFTNIELRVDDIDAKLDRVLDALIKLREAQEPAPAPRRKRAAPKRG